MKVSPVTDGVKEYELDSWDEFWELREELFSTSPAFVYRGQANVEWPLESSLDRLRKRYPQRKNMTGSPPFFNCPPFTDKEHLAAFKRAVRGRRGPSPPPLNTDDEYWALGQHYGLATPLLDISRSPFVALFFAFEETQILAGGKLISPEFRGVYGLSTHTIASPPCPAVSFRQACMNLFERSGIVGCQGETSWRTADEHEEETWAANAA